MSLARLASLAVVLVLCAGCSQQDLAETSGPYSGRMSLVGPASAAELAAEPAPPRKTVASKVLSAIALEKVTGLKPDPARFNEVD